MGHGSSMPSMVWESHPSVVYNKLLWSLLVHHIVSRVVHTKQCLCSCTSFLKTSLLFLSQSAHAEPHYHALRIEYARISLRVIARISLQTKIDPQALMRVLTVISIVCKMFFFSICRKLNLALHNVFLPLGERQ